MTQPPAHRRPRDPYRAGALRRWCRRGARAARGIAVTLAWSAVWAVGRLFHPGARRARDWRVRIFRNWARGMLRAARVRVTVEGAVPREPCLLVTNHVGYADILVLASVVDGVFVSMREVRNWPVVGFMAARMGTIFLDRARKRALPGVIAAMEAALARGDVVVLFPEGGNSDGSAVRPFRPSLLDAPARLDVPLAWGALHYAVLPGDPPASRSICWFDEPFPRQAARFLALEEIHATLRFGDGRLRGTDRKELAAELHARVTAAFRPIV